MSIASAPEADGPVEFYIRRIAKPVSRNPLTSLLWRRQVGDRIHMRTVAAGRFTMGDTMGAGDKRLRVMVAAGTGIAPFMSMIRSEVFRNPDADLARWVLLHGVSHPSDLAYRKELLDIGAANHLRYWGSVSRASEASAWTGDRGRVESFFDPGRLADLEARLGLPRGGFAPENVVILICGLNGTIVETMMRLIDRAFVPCSEKLRNLLGVPAGIESSVYFEQYDPDESIIDASDGRAIEPLRGRMQAALESARQRSAFQSR
jgi:ferredoxin--NADP+ reductase